MAQTFAKAENLSLLFYNVENFSMKTEMTKSVGPFLPQAFKGSHLPELGALSEKNHIKQAHKSHKADLIAKVISSSVDTGPDIITLAEIHNPKSLEFLINRLNQNTHKNTYDLHYSYISHSEAQGNAQNLAILYKSNIGLKVLKIEEHFVKINGHNLNRPLLESTFKYNKEVFHLFTLHLPSPAHPTKERTQVIEYLKKILTRIKSQEQNPRIIITGDFNTTTSEEAEVLKALDLNKQIIDIKNSADQNSKGTIFYHPKQKWSYFDKFLVSANLLSTNNKPALQNIQAKKGSFRVITTEGKDIYTHGQKQTIPKSSTLYLHTKQHLSAFQKLSNTGPSDHFPIVMQLKINAVVKQTCSGLFQKTGT